MPDDSLKYYIEGLENKKDIRQALYEDLPDGYLERDICLCIIAVR